MFLATQFKPTISQQAKNYPVPIIKTFVIIFSYKYLTDALCAAVNVYAKQTCPLSIFCTAQRAGDFAIIFP